MLADVKPYLGQHFRSFDGTADLYIYFYELALSILRPGGRLGYIVTNKWLKAGYGQNLRGLYAERAWLETIVDLGHNKEVFPDADVFPCILTARKPDDGPVPEAARVCILPREMARLDDLARQVEDTGSDVPRTRFTAAAWSLEPPGVSRLMDKIRRTGVPLRDFIGVSPLYGVKTGFNDAFIVDRKARDRLLEEHSSSADILRPFLRGRDVDRWHAEYQDLWLLYVPWHFPLHLNPSVVGASDEAEQRFAKCYPAVYKHLLGFKRELSGRNAAETGVRYEWYALQRWGAEYWHEFERPKIVYQDITWTPSFCLDTTNLYANNTIYFLPTGDLWTLAALNAPVSWWFAWRTAQHGKDEALRLFTDYLNAFPVPSPTDAQREEVEPAVSRLVSLTAERQAGRRAVLDWLRVEFGVTKPSQRLSVADLSADGFAAEVRKHRGRAAPLSVAAVKQLNDEYAASVAPLHDLGREAAALERRLSNAVNAAYGLNPDDVKLLWATAPPRMPFSAE